MRLFIANVGARDLQVKINGRLYSLDVRPHEQEKAQVLEGFLSGSFNQTPDQLGVRALGKWLLQQKESQQEKFQQFLKEVVACPILEPALDLALGEAQTDEAQTLDVYLLGTDQPDDAPANLRANDTYWAAEIIKQWLCQYYKNREKLGQVCVLKISDIVPARWDEAYQLIASLKVAVDGNQVELRKLLQESQEVFAEISGGIPALNFALHQVVLNVCGRKARIIQVLEGEGRAHLLKIQVFWGDRLIRQLHTLLGSYDYKAAADLLENEIPKDQRTEEIQKAIAALRHADARLNFDFQKALTAIEDYKSVDPLDPFQDWYNSANHQTFADRVREALGCLEIFRRSHRLIAFIALADGIVEGLVRLAAETLEPTLQKIYRADKDKDQPIPNPFVPRRYANLGELPKPLQGYLERYLQSQRKGASGEVLADEQFYDGIINYYRKKSIGPQKSAIENVNSDLGRLRTCLGGFRNGLLHSLANLSEDALSSEVVRHGIAEQPENALEKLVEKMEEVLENILSQLTSTATDPRVGKQIERWLEASQQSSKQVASSPKSKRLVFDDINDFVLQTLSKAWEVPLPPQ